MNMFEIYEHCSTPLVDPQLASNNCASLLRLQSENRLLNTQAEIEYELLKRRLISGISEMNKFFDLDDQIIVQEYKLCASLRYRKQIFVMELRQVVSNNGACNHSLDLIFQGAAGDLNTVGRTTLVLARVANQFVWRQLYQNVLGPTGTSKALSSIVLRWLQNETNFLMHFASV